MVGDADSIGAFVVLDRGDGACISITCIAYSAVLWRSGAIAAFQTIEVGSQAVIQSIPLSPSVISI
jgi:hypothetical protein